MNKVNIVKHLNLDVYKIQDEVVAKGQVKICDHIIKIRKENFDGFATMITYDLIKPNNKSIQVFTILEALKNITLKSERAND